MEGIRKAEGEGSFGEQCGLVLQRCIVERAWRRLCAIGCEIAIRPFFEKAELERGE